MAAKNARGKNLRRYGSATRVRTLAETVVRTRCKGCGERPARVYLTADGCGVNVSGGSQGWVILLHNDTGLNR